MIRHLQSPSRPSRVLILGSSGFVGTHLKHLLERSSVEVHGFSSKEIDLTSPACVSQLREVARADDVLVVVSALTPDRGRDIATMVKNIRMGEHICEFLAASRCSHVVYISSDAVYAEDAHPVRESSCADPTSFHGLMHVVRERVLQATAKTSGIPLMIVRPAAIYGPGDTHNSYGPNRFVRTAKSEGRIKLFGNGEEKRDHVHIRDVVSLVTACLESRAKGTLNIATGQAVSFLQVAQTIAELGGGTVAIDTSPRQSEITHRHFDITELIQAFPSFQFIRLIEGLTEMMEGANVRR